ncbi:MAG: glycosyltransferase family 9 protein [Ignavibacteria bacterium]
MNVIVVQTAFLGDVLLTLPLCAAVKRTVPGATVTFVTTPAAASMVAYADVVDRVVEFDKRGKHRSLQQQKELAQSLGGDKTAVLVAHKSWRTALFVRSIPADISIAFADSPAKWFASVSIEVPRGLHAAERYMQLLAPLLSMHTSMPSLSDCVPIRLTDRSIASMRRDQPHVVLAPGSVWATKQWPAARFRALAAKLVHEGMRVSVIGDASVSDVAHGIEGVENFAGATSMSEAAGIVAQSTILVANDSAPVHLASLQNVPTVAIFGPTVPEFGFGPFGSHVTLVQRQELQCRPCSDHGTKACPLGTHECMTSITVEEVFGHIQHLLQRSR